MGGRSAAAGFHLSSCRSFSALSELVTESFTTTTPGLRCESQVVHCFNALMSIRAVCLKGVSKNLCPVVGRYHYLAILCSY